MFVTPNKIIRGGGPVNVGGLAVTFSVQSPQVLRNAGGGIIKDFMVVDVIACVPIGALPPPPPPSPVELHGPPAYVPLPQQRVPGSRVTPGGYMQADPGLLTRPQATVNYGWQTSHQPPQQHQPPPTINRGWAGGSSMSFEVAGTMDSAMAAVMGGRA